MPTTKYQWVRGAPAVPGLHRTCLSSDKYHSARYWDGRAWWDIASTRGNKALPFTLPKAIPADVKPLLAWTKHYSTLSLRTITDQSKVRCAIPYKHYEPAEVLKWLVNKGRLRADWKDAYQEDMRNELKGGDA